MAKSITGIPRILVEPTFRLVCLRLVLIATIMFLSPLVIVMSLECRSGGECWLFVGLAVIFGIILVHHLASALGPKRIPLFTWMDLLLSAGELGFCILIAVALFQDSHLEDILDPLSWIHLTLTLFLGCLFILKVLQVIDASGRALFHRADVLASSRDTLFTTSVSTWKYFLRATVGTLLWRNILPGESQWIAILRGLLVVAAIFALFIFGFIEVISDPFSELDVTPTREYRTISSSPNSTNITWNLIVGWRGELGTGEDLRDAVNVIPWAPNRTCEAIKNEVETDSPGHSFLVFDCAPWNKTHAPDLLWNDSSPLPDIFLRVDFSGLAAFHRPPGNNGTIRRESLEVYSALTNITEDVLTTTRPTLLFPGMNLVGVVNPVVRRQFRRRKLSVLGLSNSFDTFAIAEMSTASVSSIGTPQDNNPNVSTLHITYQGPPGEWRIVQDFREKSVLNGFSSAGGLGSFVSLICALLFGTNLFSFLFRTKPFSAFGILHGLPSQQAEVARVCLSKYPQLEAELRALEAEESRGVMALLLDTLLDLESIRAHAKKARPSTSSSGTEGGRDSDHSGEEDAFLNEGGKSEVVSMSERNSAQDA